MTEIRFYHLQTYNLDQALPQILGKALSAGHKINVRLPDTKEVERINTLLWTFRPDSFLPHGSQKDGYAEDQPIWLTDKDENTNKANVLVLTNGLENDNLDTYTLVCDMFDGRNDEMVKAARERWKSYKEAGHEITYWQQDQKGAWSQAA